MTGDWFVRVGLVNSYRQRYDNAYQGSNEEGSRVRRSWEGSHRELLQREREKWNVRRGERGSREEEGVGKRRGEEEERRKGGRRKESRLQAMN